MKSLGSKRPGLEGIVCVTCTIGCCREGHEMSHGRTYQQEGQKLGGSCQC